MYTSLIILQHADINTIHPYIDYFAKKYHLSKADIIRNVLYQYFGYQAPERSSKQREQEYRKEISLRLSLQNKYIPVFLDIDFQVKYLDTSSFRSMTIIVNILNKFFNSGIPLEVLTRKQLNHKLNPQISSNFEDILTETFRHPWNSVYKYDMKLLHNLNFFKTIIAKGNVTLKRRNRITKNMDYFLNSPPKCSLNRSRILQRKSLLHQASS